MNTAKVTEKITRLQPLLDLSGFCLKTPSEDELEHTVLAADYWLGELIADFLGDFDAIYDLEHTGVAFWENVHVLGLQSDDDLMSDLQPCTDMRKLLAKFRRRCVKNLPILFGGVKRAQTKAKTKARDGDPESHNRHASSARVAGEADERLGTT